MSYFIFLEFLLFKTRYKVLITWSNWIFFALKILQLLSKKLFLALVLWQAFFSWSHRNKACDVGHDVRNCFLVITKYLFNVHKTQSISQTFPMITRKQCKKWFLPKSTMTCSSAHRFKSLQSVLVCWFLTVTCLLNCIFCTCRVMVCVRRGRGGG